MPIFCMPTKPLFSKSTASLILIDAAQHKFFNVHFGFWLFGIQKCLCCHWIALWSFVVLFRSRIFWRPLGCDMQCFVRSAAHLQRAWRDSLQASRVRSTQYLKYVEVLGTLLGWDRCWIMGCEIQWCQVGQVALSSSPLLEGSWDFSVG